MPTNPTPELPAELPAELSASVVAQLVAARRSAGLSQAAVAYAMGTFQPHLSKIENGATSPRLSTVESYARAVGARIVWRVELATNEPGEPGPTGGE